MKLPFLKGKKSDAIYYSKEEMLKIIGKIIKGKELQAKWNGVEFIGLTEEEIMGELYKRIGNKWEIANEDTVSKG